MRRKILRRTVSAILSAALLVTPALALTGTVNTESLRLRQEPSLTSQTLSIVKKNTDVTITGAEPVVNSAGVWYAVACDGLSGYMSADYLTLADPAGQCGTVAATSVNLRSAPSTSGGIIRVLSKNTVVSVTGDLRDGWYPVSCDGTEGYLKAEFLSIAAAVPASSPSDADKYGIVATARLNLRSKPSLGSPTVKILTIGTVLELDGVMGGWYSVTHDGDKGYVHPDYIELASEKPEQTIDGFAVGFSGTIPGEALVQTGRTKLGCPYVYGKAGPNSFDCSGFTSYVYKQHGVSLSRTAVDQYRLNGQTVSSASALQAGDLVFFRDTKVSKNVVSHVGMYVGGGQFIHAGSGTYNGGKCVKISNLSTGYYKSIYVAGKRVFT